MATCATPILNATRATVFPQKEAAATINFNANAIWGLFKDSYYSKCGVYSSKYGKRGRAQPSFKARAIVYGSSRTAKCWSLKIRCGSSGRRVKRHGLDDAGQTRAGQVTWHVCFIVLYVALNKLCRHNFEHNRC